MILLFQQLSNGAEALQPYGLIAFATMEQDELPDPVHIGFFGTAAVVTNVNDGPDLVQQAWLFHIPSNVLISMTKTQQMIALANIKLL